MAFGRKKEEARVAVCTICYQPLADEEKVCPNCGEATAFMTFEERKAHEVEQWRRYREGKATASPEAKKEDLGEIEAFQRVPILKDLSVGQMHALAKRTTEVRFAAGDELIRQGDRGGPLFLIVEGKAQVHADGRQVATLGLGDFVGEITVIDSGPRSATVRAETEVRALSVEGDAFLGLLQENWLVTHKVLIELSGRLRATQGSHAL